MHHHHTPPTTLQGSRKDKKQPTTWDELNDLKRTLRLNLRKLAQTHIHIGAHAMRFGEGETALRLLNHHLRQTHAAIALTNLIIIGSYLGALSKKETKEVLQEHSLDDRITACKAHAKKAHVAIQTFSRRNIQKKISHDLKLQPFRARKSPFKVVIYTAVALRIISGTEALQLHQQFTSVKLPIDQMTTLESRIQAELAKLKRQLQGRNLTATLKLLRTPLLPTKAPRTLFT